MTESNTPRPPIPRDWLDYRDHTVFGVSFRGLDSEARAIRRTVVTSAIYAEITTAQAQIETGTMVVDIARIEREFFLFVCDVIDSVVAKRNNQ